MEQSAHGLNVDAYEGPYDVLLELAQGGDVDLTTISLGELTDDYLRFVQQGGIQPSLVADFLVVAATVLLLKLKQLLPSLSDEEEEEITELTDRLRIYRLYRTAAVHVLETWSRAPLLAGSPRPGIAVDVAWPEFGPQDAHHHLLQLLAKILPVERFDQRSIKRRGKTMEEYMSRIKLFLQRFQSVHFHQAVGETSAYAAAVSLLAALELARTGEIELQQAHVFGPITLKQSSGPRSRL